jgi:hypothetical protein
MMVEMKKEYNTSLPWLKNFFGKKTLKARVFFSALYDIRVIDLRPRRGHFKVLSQHHYINPSGLLINFD